jgi:hypothetical protein
MRNLIVSIALLSGLYIVGCGSSTPGSSSVSCESNAGMIGHTCITYTGPAATSAGVCGAAKSVSSCPTTNKLGQCSLTQSAGGVSQTVVTVFYSDGGETAMTAQATCMAESGTFTM